ncbi:ABC transporter ATP-binding protein [Mycolicibacterium canariasense]|uniref:ABC transporter ATP-binding protein n=1 Tax=Mycolicibacterium canariasense TaxID=228230 RepID=A0A100WCV4_MYCCR|nr:AarF/ABC1/UbiB kinase family protein [Mycolicibacterium canariasense]MCV7212508.1 AarF/ABC1/UbiB kinase family protein [Mycolicibacterium canariasense]ORU95395.1 hypothetical protein AWB94_31535 [Mycolicibacterium canariasense]GAS95633.1 ABC transporter ATP-binding protein [Mycolicibacterium canariasense]
MSTPDDRQARARVTRGARLSRVAVNHASRAALRRVREPLMSDEEKAAARDAEVLRLADDLVSALGTMKGAAMKLGQAISLLNFGLSSAAARDEFARRLAPLYRRAPAVPNAVMLGVLDSELGDRRGELASIEPEPLASASLGQVYRGELADGRTVAVKVQYPSAQSSVRADLKNLALLVRLRSRDFPSLGLDELVGEISHQIRLELDYERELQNHLRVYQDYLGHPVFRIPSPIESLCTPRVLTTEYLGGTTLDQLGVVPAEVADHLGEAVYRFYCGGVHTLGRFCADPHPGNIIALADGSVGFLDFGLYVDMDAAQRELERAVLRAVLAGDSRTTYELARAGGFIVDETAMPEPMVMDYLTTVAAWHLTPGVVTVTPEVAHRSLSQAMLPRSAFRKGMYRQRVPREHLFSRRTEMSVCALLGDLRASGPWRAISEEWVLDGEPATAMGRRIAQWESTRIG